MSEIPAYVPPENSIPTLEVPSLEGVRRAHLVGIGGAGMRGIAHLLERKLSSGELFLDRIELKTEICE